MDAHTPGPWSARFDHDATGYPCYFLHGVSGDEKRNVQRLAANARLIAAAPELLEALNGLLNALPSATTHPAIKAARAVIAKAEGRG